MLQVVKYDDFVNSADRQYVRPSNRVFNRGTIYFESKDNYLVAAATLKSGYKISINPKVLENASTTYDAINSVVPLDAELFFAKASKKLDPYEELAKRVPETEAKKIEAMDIPGVIIEKDQWRVYPGGNTGAHLLGFVAYKGDELAGRYGLERQYENLLSRKQEDLFANFFVEIFSDIKRTVTDSGSLEGNLVTTIEPTVQGVLEDAVSGIQNKWGADATGGIIINPQNGDIYAMAVRPTFDPNNFRDVTDISVFSNPLVEDVREMGSVIKALTMAAGIDAGVVNAGTRYDDSGFLKFDNYTIFNWDKKGRGNITMQQVMNESLNTGAAYVMQKLGKDRFREYMMNFGLKEKTGIDLPNEVSNIITNLESPRSIEYVTASYGQGIALTPISTVRAFSALANGGTLITPHVVKKIDYTNKLFKNVDIPAGKRVITEATSKEITRMLVEVLDSSLLGGKAKNPHYSIAAKTGTAQIANPEGGGYYEDRFLHSFFGYFPASNPEFLVLLYTVNPKEVSFAANTLASPFLDISKFIINYYEIPPDR